MRTSVRVSSEAGRFELQRDRICPISIMTTAYGKVALCLAPLLNLIFGASIQLSAGLGTSDSLNRHEAVAAEVGHGARSLCGWHGFG